MDKFKTLILTEKPSVGREFAEALSPHYKMGDGHIELDNFVITWAIGHLLTPFDPEDYDKSLKKWSEETLPIIPLKFFYKSIPQTKKQLDVIKKIFKRKDINRLIVATDAGREGELIARLILNEVKSKLPSIRFFTSDALTKNVILDGMKKARPLKDFDRLYIAGKARQNADWIVGMNLSRIVSIKMGDLYSIGRVQTAVLDLLVERRLEIDNFIPKDYFELKARFQFRKDAIDTYWFDPNNKIDEKRKDKKSDFEKIVQKIDGKKAVVTKKEEKEKIVYPDGLYSLTDLQRRANQEFGLSASKTLEIAQALYEKYKVLSYPRTESKVMGTSSFDLVKEKVYLFKNEIPEYFNKFQPSKVNVKNKAVFDDGRLTDHHGLIPLKMFNGRKDSLEWKIFNLVLKKFVSNFLENHKYIEVDFEIKCEGEHFKSKARKILEMGFKELDDSIKDDLISNIDLNEEGQLVKHELESKKTRPNFEYTESTLLYDMTNPARLVDESEFKKIFRTEIGIGTQATRANIIETIIKRGYVKRSGKSIIATEKGVGLISKLKKMSISTQITSVKETAKWELELSKMAQGEILDEEFSDNISDFVTEAVIEWKKEENIKSEKNYAGKKTYAKKSIKVVSKCPRCGKNVVSFPKSYSCEGWKEGCKFSIWKEISGFSLKESDIKLLIEKKKSKLISGFKSKKGNNFSAYLVLQDTGKVEFEFENKYN